MSNLQDLAELHEWGEQVIWPEGHTLESAKALISSHTYTTGAEAAGDPSQVSTSLGATPAASSGASSSKMVPQDIIKWVKPAPKIIVAPRMRKCISIKDYNAKKLQPAININAQPAERVIAPVACLDDPDAPFIEEDDTFQSLVIHAIMASLPNET